MVYGTHVSEDKRLRQVQCNIKPGVAKRTSEQELKHFYSYRTTNVVLINCTLQPLATFSQNGYK